MTLEKIRAALPTHIMLTPGKVMRGGDEWSQDDDEFGRCDAAEHVEIGEPLLDEDKEPLRIPAEGIWRRPIPTHILDNQAFWLLLDKGFEAPDHFADKAENLGIVKKLGGLDNYRKQRKVGRLYDKWILEQMEDV